MSRARGARSRSASLIIWHRRLGLSAALFVLVLATTGLALNHTAELGLDRRYLEAEWLLNWYGIQAPAEASVFVAGSLLVTQLGDRVYLGTRAVEEGVGTVGGAVEIDDLVVTAVDGDLLLLTASGERVERLGRKDDVPAGLTGIGTDSEGGLLLRTDAGLYRADEELLRWLAVDAVDVNVVWSTPATADAATLAELRADYRGRILSLERVLLDLHSGRILGRFGPLLMDLAAILLTLLAVTGVWVWSSRRP
ncbi:MAG: PepSY domain-containing protein [Gammaproteobacteria bacterium]